MIYKKYAVLKGKCAVSNDAQKNNSQLVCDLQ